MIIDFHTHVFPPRIKQNHRRYLAQDRCFAALYAQKTAKLATAEELIHSMDQAGIDKSVIVNIGWVTPELCAETNDYILESIARYPQRLIGFCSVQPQSIEAAIAEIERCARAGIKGVGELRPDMQSFDLTNQEIMSPLVETIRKNHLILLIHTSEPVGHEYTGKGAITPEKLYPFIASYPDISLVCAHWGGGLPFYALMPEIKKALKHVYFDTAASSFLYRPQVYQQVSQLVGADKILFGSDYPLLAQRRLIEEINATDLPAKAKRLILAGNARRLLGLKDRD